MGNRIGGFRPPEDDFVSSNSRIAKQNNRIEFVSKFYIQYYIKLYPGALYNTLYNLAQNMIYTIEH